MDFASTVDSFRHSHRLPGLAVARWTPAGTDIQVSGDADPDLQYRIASITKTFTGTAVMQLRDAGKLALTDPVGAYLPGTIADRVTLAQLLTHTSGLRAEPDGPWWERDRPRTLAEVLAQLEFVFTPGTRFHYCNPGYGLLGEVVARVSGLSWAQYVREHIVQPLGMASTSLVASSPATGYAVHPHADLVVAEPAYDGGALAPAGHLWSSPRDMAQWMRFLAGDAPEVLAPATLAEMSQPLSVVDVRDQPFVSAYGLSLEVMNLGGRRLVGHTGSLPGFQTVVRVDPAGKAGVFAAANSGAGGLMTFPITEVLGEAPAPQWSPAPPTATVSRLVGHWYWGAQEFLLASTGGDDFTLTPVGAPARGARFVSTGEGTWVGLDGYYAGERLVDQGSWLDVATFCFTRTPYDPAAPIPGGLDARGWQPFPG